MIKSIITYSLIITTLYFTGLFLHSHFIKNEANWLQYLLKNIYIFNALFTLLICVVFEFLSQNKKAFQQLGFIYLGVLVFKIILFSIVFYKPVFTIDTLSKIESISLLTPIIFFLIIEVYFVAKIINRK